MKKIFATILTLVLGIACLCHPVMATSQSTIFGDTLDPDKVVILKTCAGKTGEESIKCVLNIVVNIMSVLIGILGVIGITITGIQYLTAGGSEEKTRKAKRRMFEIVIGLAVYAVMYALLSWLLPSDTKISSPTTQKGEIKIIPSDGTTFFQKQEKDSEACINSGWNWDNQQNICWR